LSFVEELKRRNVFRVSVAYVVAAWVLLQAADLVLENISAPEWVIQALMLVVLLGFIAAVVIAWAYEITPEGIKREADVDRTQSITNETALKLDRIIIGFLAVAVAVLLIERFIPYGKEESAAINSETRLTEMAPLEQQTPDSVKPKAAADNSIAVLPFANRSNVKDDLFFTDGIHDDLLTQLSKISDLKVISRTSMMKYKDTQLTIPEIAKELNVATILEGGVQRAGTRIRINAQLIDVSSDEHLWAETFDREMTIENLFDIQSEITRQIVNAVKGELTEAEQLSLAQVPTNNQEAYEAYLQARAILNRADYSQERYIEAQAWVEKAVELDPEFSNAWALLSQVHGQAVWIGYDSSPERQQASKDALNKAIEYGPDLPQTLAARAEYQYRIELDFAASLELFRAAHRALPGDVDIIDHRAMAERRMGLWEDSVNSLLKVIELNPASSSAANQAIGTLIMMRQWERANHLIDQWVLKYPDARDMRVNQVNVRLYQSGDLDSARSLMDRMQPWISNAYISLAVDLPMLERDYEKVIDVWDQPVVQAMADNRGWLGYRDLNRGIAYQMMGNNDAALTHLNKVVELISGAPPAGPAADSAELQTLAWAYALLGENQKALDASARAVQMMPEKRDRISGTITATLNAYILALTGHRDEALAEIERLLIQPAGFNRWILYLHPTWDFFRDDERFNKLIRPLNLEEP
jgi:TolB-like protein